ncbi:hypothetical protein CJF42_06205 [Pseudoalteromonas sp. NBT06-2]|nr:hypothetical protein CJF42_06205 [Pseudoalteromonas sp. NBT06-2]
MNSSMFDHFMNMERIDLHAVINNKAACSELFLAEKFQNYLNMDFNKEQKDTGVTVKLNKPLEDNKGDILQNKQDDLLLKNIIKADIFEWPLPEKPGYEKVDIRGLVVFQVTVFYILQRAVS